MVDAYWGRSAEVGGDRAGGGEAVDTSRRPRQAQFWSGGGLSFEDGQGWAEDLGTVSGGGGGHGAEVGGAVT